MDRRGPRAGYARDAAQRGFAEEGQEDQPPAVEAGQQRGERAEPEGDRARTPIRSPRRSRGSRPSTRSRRSRTADDADAGDRQRADDHHPEGDRDLLPERAVVTHVLLVVHGVDDAARAEEQQRLEEGVGEQMEHRRAVGADARGEEHVAELRAGRISDHPLDVVLGAADGRGEDAGRGADIGDDVHRGRATSRTSATGGRP